MRKLLLSLMSVGLMTAGGAQGEDLLQVYQLAQQNDAQLKTAQAQRDSAFEKKPQAEALLKPSVALSASANGVRSDVMHSPTGSSLKSYTTANLSLSVSHPLYHRDYWIQLGQADRQVAQASSQYAADEQDLIVRATTAYFDVLSAQDSLEFSKSENTAIARQLDQSKQRFEVGLIAITSVHETQAVFDQSSADLIAAENSLDNAWEVLHEIISQPVKKISAVADDLPLNPPSPSNIERWGEKAQQENLAIKAASFSADIARDNIKLQDAGDAPTVDLVGSHAINLSSSKTGSDSQTTTVGVQFNMPLYTGGAVFLRTRQAHFDYTAAQEELDRQRRSVNRQVRTAYRGVVASISAVEALKASTVSTQSALEATTAGFDVGTRTMVDVLNAQRDLFRSKSNYAKARYNYILSGISLKQATGTLSIGDLKQVNSWLK